MPKTRESTSASHDAGARYRGGTGVSLVTFQSNERALAATLEGLAEQQLRPAIVWIHANACTSADADRLRVQAGEWCRDVSVIVTSSEQNLGFCQPHNTSLRELFENGVENVLVLNPDLVLAPDGLAALVAATESDRRALYGPLLELADPKTFAATGRIDSLGIRWAPGARHLDIRQGEAMTDLPSGAQEVDGLSGACILVSREVHQRIVEVSGEFFDVDFFAYREDAELGYRAKLLGIPCRLVPAARGLHVRHLRGTTREVDPLINALGVRNRFLFAFKYGPRRPGGAVSAVLRDVVVVAAVLLVERSSLPALREAWQLRARMREKGRRLTAARQARR